MTIIPTQASRLIAHIRARGKRGMSYLDLLLTGVSVCPWKRLEESAADYLKAGEKLERFIRMEGGKERVHFRIVRA